MNSSVGEPTVVELQEMAERLLRWSDRLNADYDIGTALNVRGDRVLAVAISHYRSRRQRDGHFPRDMFGEPAWDMMLDLMLAGAHGRMLSASDLATGAGVPLSSGLRMISALERLGLVHRSIDERDRRRTIVRLTDTGVERMATYFEKIGAAWQGGQTLAYREAGQAKTDGEDRHYPARPHAG